MFTLMTYVTPLSHDFSPAATSWNFLAIPSGMAILDIGATQDIIGKTAFKALEHELDRCGLRTLEVPTTASAPTGIGGTAQVKKTALVPISPGGVPGVIQFLVIDGEWRDSTFVECRAPGTPRSRDGPEDQRD